MIGASRQASIRFGERSLLARLKGEGRRDQRVWSRSSKTLSDEALKAHRINSASGSRPAKRWTTSWSRPSRRSARRPNGHSGQRHFDVQLLGGMVLHQGKISEMKTGEGKTLVATLPVYLNALRARASTSSRSTTSWRSAMPVDGQVYERARADRRLHRPRPRRQQRREQYACDITYGTNNEFGFDYLRDNMKFSWTRWFSASSTSPSSTRSILS